MQQLIFLLIALIATACQSTTEESAAADHPAVPVLAVKPEVKDLTLYIEAIGSLKPELLIEIRPQVSGIVTAVMVKEGEQVKEGTPLLQIDRQQYALKVQEVAAQLAMDQANYKAIEQKLNRYYELSQKDLIAKVEWEELESQLAKAKAMLDLSQARLEAAKLDLERTLITAPAEGQIGKIDLHKGSLVNSSQALFTLSKNQHLIAEFSLTEKELAKLPKDEKNATISSLCTPEGCVKGTITFLDHHFDSKSGLLLMRGSFDNQSEQLRPGQIVKVLMPSETLKAAKLIPQKAVRYNDTGAYLYVILSDQTVGFRQVVLGNEEGNLVTVTEGLDQDEYVITDGHLRLSPGTKVEVK